MSNEARIQSSLQIKGPNNKFYISQPGAFTANVASGAGPTPGSLQVTPAGKDVDLSQLTKLGGFCRIMNMDTDATNYLEVGIWDQVTKKFYPFMELLPGESYVIRLSRWIGIEWGTGTGTGTHEETGTGDRLRLRANARTIEALVEAHDA